MPTFSQRIGMTPTRSVIQIDELDEETRTDLWNSLFVSLSEFTKRQASNEGVRHLTSEIWANDLKRARDEEPNSDKVWIYVKMMVTGGEWYEALDIVEAFVGHVAAATTWQANDLQEATTNSFNKVFDKHLVGYRFVGTALTPMDTKVAVEAIEKALEVSQEHGGVSHHLQRSVELLSSRTNPDYPNSIKESISAVESLLKKLTSADSVAKGLKQLEQLGIEAHPALLSAWTKMYGWTSDADGIRHGGLESAKADQALAKYMLIICSGFVSYLSEQSRILGLNK